MRLLSQRQKPTGAGPTKHKKRNTLTHRLSDDLGRQAGASNLRSPPLHRTYRDSIAIAGAVFFPLAENIHV